MLQSRIYKVCRAIQKLAHIDRSIMDDAKASALLLGCLQCRPATISLDIRSVFAESSRMCEWTTMLIREMLCLVPTLRDKLEAAVT